MAAIGSTYGQRKREIQITVLWRVRVLASIKAPSALGSDLTPPLGPMAVSAARAKHYPQPQ